MNRLENLMIDTFVQNYESYLEKFNKILVKSKSIHKQNEKLNELKNKIKIDTKQYKKRFNEEQKSICLSEFNGLVKLLLEVKKRIKLIDKKIKGDEEKSLIKYNPELFIEDDFDYGKIKKEIKEYLNIKPIEVIRSLKKKHTEIFDFIHNVKEKKLFLDELKNNFKTERGVEMRSLIELLKADGIIIIGNRQFKNFFKLFGEYLDRNIGSYQSINDAKDYIHSNDVIIKKLQSIISKHKQFN